MTENCKVCDEKALKRCSECQSAYYCSAACQKADWPSHKAGCQIQKVLNKHNKAQAKATPEQPDDTRCTGCNTKWSEEFECDQECPDCGYLTCEDCACDSSRGTCHCLTSNFGVPYCEREPAWYHGGRGKRYSGDRHPEDESQFPAEAWESAPRKCGNCGEMATMLKKRYSQ
ncbi:hypothetical protein BOTBODRAFT_32405 [Botryobasidium botryosum FD-172 SS1]|uniref:MYND-type domain-containing protein n=1 Tax=Botryobasidium botryosum (strain FD-172 SS1) TaxID=930990 RepID=A0A067MRZ7_BOTB1|nr:hypothetical protein BOTBODRAFT_32405 [Botryobasidium botryosum FD-172 SS1]